MSNSRTIVVPNSPPPPDGYVVVYSASGASYIVQNPSVVFNSVNISPNFGQQTVTGGAFAVNNGATMPTLTSGTGAPTGTAPAGSLYMRTDGTTTTGLYIFESGAWAALGTGGGGGSGVSLENAGSALAGSPFATLNLTGSLSATNAGGGVANVTSSGGGGGNTVYSGFGAPGAFHNNGDIYFDISQTPAQGYVQEVVTVSPSLDGSLSGTFSTSSSFTSGAFVCSSSCKLLVAMLMFQQSSDVTVSTVTSTGLTFTRHSFVDNGGANSRYTRIEIWTAPVTTALNQTISLTLSGTTDDASVYFFGVDGINTGSPFESGADVTGFNANGVSTLTLTGVSTSNANDLLMYAIGANVSGPPVWAPAPNFTKLINVYNPGGVEYSELQVCYQTLGSTVSGLSINTGLTSAIAAAALSIAFKGVAGGTTTWIAFGGTPPLVTTFARLPVAPYTGQRAVITDSQTTTFDASVTGGGTFIIPVWWNGTGWYVG